MVWKSSSSHRKIRMEPRTVVYVSGTLAAEALSHMICISLLLNALGKARPVFFKDLKEPGQEGWDGLKVASFQLVLLPAGGREMVDQPSYYLFSRELLSSAH